jgi:hypothetical protein
LPVKPVAPFSNESSAIAASAFDRINGRPLPDCNLQTYREALAQYYLHPKNKFLRGSSLGRGPILRRHIVASSILCLLAVLRTLAMIFERVSPIN